MLDPQDVGNLNYGYIGIPRIILYVGAGANQLKKYKEKTLENCYTISFCDDPRDTIFIRMGAVKYDTEN